LKKQSQFMMVQRSTFRVLRKESQGQRLKQKGVFEIVAKPRFVAGNGAEA
jgi:hypothetical protein